jgi:Alternative oxidase
MYGSYHVFNFVTGYVAQNPSVKSIEWRLLVLESVAGVPGFIAAGFRHFRSLRTLQRDHGWIATLLEEAENERMHLLICLNMFEANFITRAMVVAAQTVMAPVLAAMYIIKPSAMHRFVGYLEETACKTYINVIDHIETPRTQLHDA